MCCTVKVSQPVVVWSLTVQMSMLAQEGRCIKLGARHQKQKCETWLLLTQFCTGHLCSSNRADRWDNYAINNGNEKKVGHATFHRPQHSHILTGLGMKSNTWHPRPLETQSTILPCQMVFLFHLGGTRHSHELPA